MLFTGHNKRRKENSKAILLQLPRLRNVSNGPYPFRDHEGLKNIIKYEDK